jgi:hypothetical protein
VKRRALLTTLAILLAVAAGCHRPAIDAAWRPPVRAAQVVDPAPDNNWPLSPEEAERLLARARIDFTSMEATKRGVSGAVKADIAFPDEGRRVRVKWKRAPRRLDGWNNNPRKEIATYVVQKWFLEPKDYVVPTTTLRCVPLAAYRRLAPKATESIEGTGCVLGTLSLWLERVTEPDRPYEPERFATDAHYAYHLSNFNVLAYLVRHRDGRSGNILVAEDEANRRVFAVDNGITFGGLIFNFLTTNWDVIRVPAIRREVVRRLRAVDRKALASLATLVELQSDATGMLLPVDAGPPLDPERGVRVADGRVQMGLTTAEIDAVAHRIAALLGRVDDGSLAVY